MPNFSLGNGVSYSITTNTNWTNTEPVEYIARPYPLVDQIGSPRVGYFVVECDGVNGYLIPDEARALTIDYIRAQMASGGNGEIDWVNFVDHLAVIANMQIYSRTTDQYFENGVPRIEPWIVPDYIADRIYSEYDQNRALEEIGMPVESVRNMAGEVVAQFTASASRAGESMRAMAERAARLTEQLTAAEQGLLGLAPAETSLQDGERELATLTPEPEPVVSQMEVIRRRRRVLEAIGHPYFTWENIPTLLHGPADRRNPAVRRYMDDMASDAVTNCQCLPCLLVYREITFHEYLDRRWAADYGDEQTITVNPAAGITSTRNTITFDEAYSIASDQWRSPRRAARPQPSRMSWRPTREEEQDLFQESYDPITGNYVEPRYQRFDRNGNEVFPSPATRNNRLPAHHPAVADAQSRNRDSWYSNENIRVRNDSSDLPFPDDDDEDYDFEAGRYSQGEPYGIMPWDYKPREFHFYGTRHNDHTPFFGFELEINSSYPNAEIVNNVPGLYTKWDGSIDGGFEIVSMPMTWEYLINDFNFDWVPALRDNGAKAGRNGLHVHVSRSGFNNDFHAWRWIKLWSDADNYAAVRTFNRRQNLEYATPFDRETPYRKARGLGIGDGSRYVMLNAQNHATFELRGPASTLNRFKLKGTLAIIAASVEYTRQKMTSQQIALGALEWRAFLEWTLEQPAYAEFVRKYLSILLEEGAPEAVYPAYLRESNG